MFFALAASLLCKHRFMSINLHFMQNVGKYNYGQIGFLKLASANECHLVVVVVKTCIQS